MRKTKNKEVMRMKIITGRKIAVDKTPVGEILKWQKFISLSNLSSKLFGNGNLKPSKKLQIFS
jgi:hypothetical protein